MKYSDLAEDLKEIITLVSGVPEKFQERCFDMLFQHLLDQTKEVQKLPEVLPLVTGGAASSGSTGVPLNAPLRVFLRRYEVTQEQLNAIFLFESGEVHFIREPAVDSIASAQVDWALLLALKSAILKGTFTVDPEDVRSICKEKGVYDLPNFAKTLKANASLFKGEMKAQGDPQQLSDDGSSKLAELVKRLAS